MTTHRSEAAMALALERIDLRACLDELAIPYRERAGEAWLTCILPTHQLDKHPSLHLGLRGVHKGDWKCFGCGEGGGLASFVAIAADLHDSKVERDDGTSPLDIDRAWAWIGVRAGVAVDPAEVAAQVAAHGVEADPRVPPPKVAASTRRQQLQLPEGAEPASNLDAERYLSSRGVPQEQASRHRLLYVPSVRRVLVPTYVAGVLVIYDLRAVDLQCSECRSTVSRAALLGGMPGVSNHHTDRACGGRFRDVQPKTYGASKDAGADPERAVFAHDWVRRGEDAIVCEGPWGALACERAGMRAVALRGSVLHEAQAALLAALPVRSWTFLADPDQAGDKLQRGAVELAWRSSALVRWGVLPRGKQPDDLEPADLREVVSRARAPRMAERPAPQGIVPGPK